MVAAKVRAPLAEALPRERLEARIAAAVERHRLTLVIAPAGSGKTTLLSRFAAGAGHPVAWYRAETWDDEPARLLRHLEAAFVRVLPRLRLGWADVESAATALDEWRGGGVVLVVDDLHTLEGTAAETALGRFVDYAPPWLRIVAASRVRPEFNLSRLRVSGELLEIEGDDLRFRSWEVERLFRDFYRHPVPPGELALLARRTEGWAAGLQLFHLATRGKSPDERRRILGGVGSSSRLLREYLAGNVLADLPPEIRRFLVDTSVLGRLSGELCDELLGRRGSAALLEELARRQIFTVAVDEVDGSYRYHEVLRGHLDRMLVEEVGETEARQRHRRAAALLERRGALAEALVAYCRAEDWAAVRNLVGDRGEQVADGGALQLELLPPALVRDSPWLALAAARRARAEGRWAAALESYARAERGFGAASAALICQRERLALAGWLDPVAIPPADWTGGLRAGLVREPRGLPQGGRDLDGPHRALVRGVLLLAGGEVVEARRWLREVEMTEDVDPTLGAAAAIAGSVAGLLAGDASASRDLDAAIEAADRLGLAWLARLGRVGSRVAAWGPADAMPEAFSVQLDPWGTALAALAEAWRPTQGAAPAVSASAPEDGPEARVAAAERAAALFRRLGAGVLETFARGLSAYGQAEAGHAEAREAALATESLARATGTAGPRLLAYAALASIAPGRATEYAVLVAGVQRETGLALPPDSRQMAAPTASREASARPDAGELSSPAMRIRAFGQFSVDVDGAPLSLEVVKPRARALLRFLAMQPGTPVHREVIQAALWPDAENGAGARSLHVAVSTLRGLLTDALGPDGTRCIARHGDAYLLDVPPDQVDVGRFERSIARGRAAKARGGLASPEFAVALAAYDGDLLPQDGPAEWVVERREQLRRDAVDAATVLAEEAMLAGDLETAIRVCRRGLDLDRYHDPLWRLLITAQDQAGDSGAAGRDRREYAAVLERLGVGPEVATRPT